MTAQDSMVTKSPPQPERVAKAARGASRQYAAGGRWWTKLRGESLVIALGAGLVLLVARLLTPDATGHGTHEHLFLLPCIFRWATGLPCPFCGMTTAFTLMADGQVLSAFESHVLGPVAYLATWGVLGGGITGLVGNRRPLHRWLFSQQGGRVLLFILLLGWAVNLGRALSGL